MTATSKTRNELIQDAASNLGILAAGQTISAEDQATIEGMVDPFIRQLSVDEIVSVDVNEIPFELFIPLGRLLANACGPKYGSPINREAQEADERELKRLTRAQKTGEPMQVDYF